MTLVGEQTFTGSTHQIRFLFRPARGPSETLCVCFGDAAEEPDFQYVDELAAIDVARLHVLDDFGPYAGEAGYPGSWYLGEGRRLTFADDVSALVSFAAHAAGAPDEKIVAAGVGAGGFAALHLALRNGWGHVVAGYPHTRLGRHLTGSLEEVARFIAGGIGSEDRRWLDELLFDALACARTAPSIDLVTSGQNYGRHVLPLLSALSGLGATANVRLRDPLVHPGTQEAVFACHLVDRVATLARTPVLDVSLDENPQGYLSTWSRRADVRLSSQPDGLRCFAPATTRHDGAVYAGVTFDAGPIETVRLDLTLRRPGDLASILVDALDAQDHRVARWQWHLSQHPASSGRIDLLLSAQDRLPFKTTIEGDLGTARKLDVFVRLPEGHSGDFSVHRVNVLPAPETPTPPAGLALPAPAADSGTLRRRSQTTLTRQVGAMVAEGAFPPMADLPEPKARRPGLKVACLLDRFSELGFRYEFDYVDFTPHDFRHVIDREEPELLLVESIWRGKDETWNKLMVPDSSGGGPTEPVIDLVRHCQARGIPTVFWNKEDSPNFEHFWRTAVLFDYIFTTDASCVPRYHEVAGHDRVHVLPFAAQPAIHNPMGAPTPRPLDVAFLGTFYGNKHPARKRQMEMILSPAREFGVHIYSRVDASGGYAFPQKYLPHVVGTVPYERALGAYRTYKVLLNVNSVPDSTTMCARRVFEILSCGGAVVSGPSPAIEAVLGSGIIHQSSGYTATREALEHVLANDSLRERTAAQGIRRVMAGHTYSDRVQEILATVGIQADPATSRVTMAASVQDDEQARAIVHTAISQSRPPDQLLLAAPPGAIDPARHVEVAGFGGVALASIEHALRVTSADLLAAASRETTGDLLGVLVAGRLYGRTYLEDLINSQTQSNADIVGKGSHFRLEPGRGWIVDRQRDENRFLDAVQAATVLASRMTVERVPPRPGEDLDEWQLRAAARGLRIYAGDRFNFAETVGTRTEQSDLVAASDALAASAGEVLA